MYKQQKQTLAINKAHTEKSVLYTHVASNDTAHTQTNKEICVHFQSDSHRKKRKYV